MSHEVERPTYDIIGPLARFDERDSLFARERLAPGSSLERAYHAMRPEHAEIDRRLLVWADDVVYGREFRPALPPRWGRKPSG